MKTKVLVVVLSILVCTSVVIANPLGAPKAGLTQGQMSVGVNYFYSETDMRSSGEFANLLGVSSFKLEDVEVHTLLGKIGFGLEDWWEMYGLVGGDSGEADGTDSDIEFAYGFGTKMTVHEEGNTAWGFLGQALWQKLEDSGTIENTSVSAELDWVEITLAVGPTVQVNESMKIYGGPFFQFIDGDLDVTIAGTGYGDDVEEESMLGGYLGTEFDLSENTALSFEGRAGGDTWGVGAGLTWKF